MAKLTAETLLRLLQNSISTWTEEVEAALKNNDHERDLTHVIKNIEQTHTSIRQLMKRHQIGQPIENNESRPDNN